MPLNAVNRFMRFVGIKLGGTGGLQAARVFYQYGLGVVQLNFKDTGNEDAASATDAALTSLYH
jgi:hypothetical protein